MLNLAMRPRPSQQQQLSSHSPAQVSTGRSMCTGREPTRRAFVSSPCQAQAPRTPLTVRLEEGHDGRREVVVRHAHRLQDRGHELLQEGTRARRLSLGVPARLLVDAEAHGHETLHGVLHTLPRLEHLPRERRQQLPHAARHLHVRGLDGERLRAHVNSACRVVDALSLSCTRSPRAPGTVSGLPRQIGVVQAQSAPLTPLKAPQVVQSGTIPSCRMISTLAGASIRFWSISIATSHAATRHASEDPSLTSDSRRGANSSFATARGHAKGHSDASPTSPPAPAKHPCRC